ncbi:MAG: diguanylate cyclase [Cyanobacteria bacterium P01_F01_bin.116]
MCDTRLNSAYTNQCRFNEYIDQTWRWLLRDQQPLSLILCDVDCFKLYNDSYCRNVLVLLSLYSHSKLGLF